MTKVAQWMRFRSKCLLHCVADEADVPHFIQEGVAVLQRSGAAVLPPIQSKDASSDLLRIVVLDGCNLLCYSESVRSHGALVHGRRA